MSEELYNSIVDAKFVEATEEGWLFDVGAEQMAFVERDELGSAPEVGETVAILVERPYGDHWAASVQKAQKLRLWDWVEELLQSGEPVEGTIIGQNKGGLSVDIGVRAFVPRSQIDIHRVDDPTTYIGRTEQFRVIKFDHKRGNVVVSRRELLEQERSGNREKLIEELAPGQEFDGVVRSVKNYGAFVDIGGVEGLLHASNMSWGRIDNPGDLFRPGDDVRVVVLDYDRKKERLSLGRKQLLEDPWETLPDRFKPGQRLEGKVVSLAEFGAFVEVEPGLEGLVHITELSWTERVEHPKQVLKLGETVEVEVLAVDPDARRLSLSRKALQDNPWESLTEQFPQGSKLAGKITNVVEFGMFVEIADGIEGLVHVSDLSWTERIENPKERYEAGQQVDVVVLGIDPEAGRVSLGIKQLEPDPWDQAAATAKVGEKVEVEIVRLADFGAFAQIVPGVEGLIHISELREDRVESVSDVVRPGQKVEALVLSFDRSTQRVSLSLKRDELEEERMREYSDEGSTTALGDLLRDKLGLGEEE